MPYKDPAKNRAAARKYQYKRRLKAIYMLSDGTMRCRICKIKYDPRVYQIDHISPLLRGKNRIKQGEETGYHLVREITKMFDAICNDLTSPDPKNVYQVLCANCHTVKTITEQRQRAEQRRTRADAYGTIIRARRGAPGQQQLQL